MKCRVDAVKAIVGALTCAAFLTIGVVAASLRYAVLAVITISLGIIYLGLAMKNGAVLVLDDAGIRRMCLGREIRRWSWSEIREYGIMGTRVFGSQKAINNGTRYIYFSENTMDDQERFKMALNWPPKKCAYALYTDELMHSAKTRLEIEPVYFNTLEP